MTGQLPRTVGAYVQAINDHDRAGFVALFTGDALVDDVGREIRGRDAIKSWSDREIFDVQVTLDVIDAAEHNGETVLMAKVDGAFDRTGLPDPLILSHRIVIQGDKIARLTCRLAGSPQQPSPAKSSSTLRDRLTASK